MVEVCKGQSPVGGQGSGPATEEVSAILGNGGRGWDVRAVCVDCDDVVERELVLRTGVASVCGCDRGRNVEKGVEHTGL